MTADRAEIHRHLIACFADVFPDLAEGEIPAARFEDLSEWDSLASLTLTAVVEDEFNVMLSDELVASLDSFQKIEDSLVDLVSPTV